MSPSTRPETPASVHSWWSDSNPGLRGPTINLHAAAKPLSKFLHHRQALDIMRKNRGSPLSTEILEIYSSYFPWNFVSWSTKAAVMSELTSRILSSEVDAHMIIDSPIFPHVVQMIGSPDRGVCISSWRLLESLSRYESIGPTILKLKLCEQLVSFLRDKRPGVIGEAASVLCELSKSVAGAQAVVNAKATDHIFMLLSSPNPYTRLRTCELVGNLASHESTAPAILERTPCLQIVDLLQDRHSNSDVMRSAAYALSQIARWLDGAQAMVEAKAADHILLLLESSNSAVREWTCEIIGRLAGHKTTALAILQPCVRILSLSGGEYSPAIEQAMFALSEMAQSEDGAQAIFNAKATDHIFILLNSPVHEVRTLSCQLVGRLASHESTAPALLELKLCAQIVSLLGDEHPTVIGAAVFALSRITRWGNGAKAVAHAKATGHMLAAMDDMLILLESPSWEVRQCTCELVGRLAGHDSPGVLELKSCVRMVSLLRDHNPQVIEWATYALSQIAQWVHIAQVTVSAKATDHILQLLDSPCSNTRMWTCVMMEELAHHRSTAPAVLRLKPSLRLAFLLRNHDAETRDRAIAALNEIRQWPDGVAALADTAGDTLQRLKDLRDDESLNLRSQVLTRQMLRNIAQYKALGAREGIPLSEGLSMPRRTSHACLTIEVADGGSASNTELVSSSMSVTGEIVEEEDQVVWWWAE